MRFCAIGIHRYRWIFVGNSWQPNDYVKACARCGREPLNDERGLAHDHQS